VAPFHRLLRNKDSVDLSATMRAERAVSGIGGFWPGTGPRMRVEGLQSVRAAGVAVWPLTSTRPASRTTCFRPGEFTKAGVTIRPPFAGPSRLLVSTTSYFVAVLVSSASAPSLWPDGSCFFFRRICALLAPYAGSEVWKIVPWDENFKLRFRICNSQATVFSFFFLKGENEQPKLENWQLRALPVFGL